MLLMKLDDAHIRIKTTHAGIYEIAISYPVEMGK